jgi:hypothetical protein
MRPVDHVGEWEELAASATPAIALVEQRELAAETVVDQVPVDPPFDVELLVRNRGDPGEPFRGESADRALRAGEYDTA